MIFWSVLLLFALMVGVLIWLGWQLGGPELNALEAALYPPMALLGVWSLLMWIVGSLWQFNRATVVACWIATLIFAFVVSFLRHNDTKPPAAKLRAQAIKSALKSLGRLERALLGYVVLVCAFTGLTALTPPSGGDYDSLVYHLAIPLRYLRENRVIELGYDHHSYFPFAFEMLFGAALSAHSDIATGAVHAKLWHWLMLPVSCAAIVAICHRHGGQNLKFNSRAGWLGAAIWASIPVVQNEAGTAYIDNALAALVLLAFGALANALWPQSHLEAAGARRWLMWSAAIIGFGVGCKYLGALYALWLGATLCVFWVASARNGDRSPQSLNVRSVATFAVVVLLVGSGWYGRNWWWTGNPVFPFAYEIFGGRGWTDEMAREYSRSQAIYGFGRGVVDWIWMPWRMAMSPFNAAGTSDGAIVGLPFWPLSGQPRLNTVHIGLFETPGFATQTMIGPLLLALGAPLLFLRGKPRPIVWLMSSVLALAIFWGATGQYLRYLLPALALWCVACGWGAMRYLERGLVLRWATIGAIALWLGTSSWLFWRNNSGVIWVALGSQSSTEYLNRTLPPYAAQNWINQNVPPDATFAVLGEPRNFYLDRHYFWADDEHNNWIEYQDAQLKPLDFSKINAQWKARGATHLLENTTPKTNGGAFGLSPEMSSQVAQNATLLHEDDTRGYRVYRLP